MSSGVGAAVGVALDVAVDCELRGRAGAGVPRLQASVFDESPLIRETVRQLWRRVGPPWPAEIALTIRSEIPPALGLKSSSAVPVAVVRAILKALGQAWEPEAVAAVAADAGLAAGVSATGAFDDALACALPGWIVADVEQRRLISRQPMPEVWVAVVWTPPGAHASAPSWSARFRARAREGQAAAAAARGGDPIDAMRKNTELVESVLGYDYRALREELATAGAIASGVSGLGPALGAFASRSDARKIADVLEREAGTVQILEFARTEAGRA